MQLEIWNLENRQEQTEARQLEAEPNPWGTSTFKWQMEERSPGRKTEKAPSEGREENHSSFKVIATKGVENSKKRMLNSGRCNRTFNKTVIVK